jgi:hypothetical protein
VRRRQLPHLFLRLLRFFSLLNHEGFNPRELLLKSVRKVRRPVFEKHDEAKREEDKKGEPKQPAQQSHGENGNLGVVAGQSPCARHKLAIERGNEPAKLLPSCGLRFST